MKTKNPTVHIYSINRRESKTYKLHIATSKVKWYIDWIGLNALGKMMETTKNVTTTRMHACTRYKNHRGVYPCNDIARGGIGRPAKIEQLI